MSPAAQPKKRQRASSSKPAAPARAQSFPLEQLCEVERRVVMLQSDSKIKQDLSLLLGITPAKVGNMIAAVRRQWIAARPIQFEQRRAFMRSALEAAVSKAYAIDDMRAAAVLLDRLCKLDGLYAPERLQLGVSGQLGISIDVGNPEAVRKRINELQQRVAGARALPGKATTP